MREFRQLLGDPPNIDNVPEAFYEKMQREVDAETYAILLLIFDDSALLHGWSGPDQAMASYGWAKQRADAFSQSWAESTRTKLEKGFERLEGPIAQREETTEEARESNRTIPAERKPVTQKEVDELIDSTWSPKTIERWAVDETTTAQHAGGEAGIEATVGLNENDIWRCDWRHDNVCEECSPLDEKPRSVWSAKFPDGPPSPHFFCRCWIQYAPIGANKSAARKSLESKAFVDAWHRTIPEAAEWRAYCRENGVDVENQAKFKAFNVSEPRASDGE
jgi:hypothetical protein